MKKKKKDNVAKWLENKRDTDLLILTYEEQKQAITRLVRINHTLALRVILNLNTYRLGRLLLSSHSIALFNTLEEQKTTKKKRKITWWHLRDIGNYQIFKLSYLAFLQIPFVENIPKLLQSTNSNISSFFIGTFFFGSIIFALANLLFDIFCPPIVKRFGSPNDLYEKMLDIKAKQDVSYPNDAWIGDLKHSQDAYRRETNSKYLICILTFLSYVIALILLFLAVGERVLYFSKHNL